MKALSGSTSKFEMWVAEEQRYRRSILSRAKSISYHSLSVHEQSFLTSAVKTVLTCSLYWSQTCLWK